MDGSALEIFNAATSVRFFNNVVQEVAALTEIGGSVPSDLVSDIVYHHNLVFNADSLGCFHNNAGGSTFGVPPAANEFYLRNNIIEHRNGTGLFYNAGQLLHQSNLYRLSNAPFGDPGFVFSATELAANPLWRDPAAGDDRLAAGSIAVDRGQALGYSADLDDLAMPAGCAPDLGAYEFR